jgi:hypothetical protein
LFIAGVLGCCFFTVLIYFQSEVRSWGMTAVLALVIGATAAFAGITVASLVGTLGQSNTLDIAWVITGAIAILPLALGSTIGLLADMVKDRMNHDHRAS